MYKVVKYLAVVVLLLIVVFGILVAVAPTEFKVERSVEINEPKEKVFSYIKFLKNQDEWAPWTKKDPNIKQTYQGQDGEVGFITIWESDHEEVGSGEQEIKRIVQNKQLDTEIRFKDPFESITQSYIILDEVPDNKTSVKWGFTGSMPRPFNVMGIFIDMEEAVGKDFDEGLANLKSILEKREDS